MATKSKTKAKPAPKTPAKAKAKATTKAKAAPKAKTATKAKTAVKAKVKAKAAPKVKPAAKPKAKPIAKTKTKTKPQAKSVAKSKAKIIEKSKPAAKPKTAAKPAVKKSIPSKAAAKPKAAAKTKAAPKAKAVAKVKAAPKAKAVAKVKAAPKAKAAVKKAAVKKPAAKKPAKKPARKKAAAKKVVLSKGTSKSAAKSIAKAVANSTAENPTKPLRRGMIKPSSSVPHPNNPQPIKKAVPAKDESKSAAESAALAESKKAKPVAKQVKLDFGTDDFVVYPTHGVGKITGIEEQEISGMIMQLFLIDFAQDKMTLRVPVGKAKTSGMRRLSTTKEMDVALTTLKGRARVKRTMWSRRAQEYEAKINSGDPVSIAEVLRDLHRNSNQPDQSYSERQIYEAALERLARELAAVEKIDEDSATERLEEVLQAA
ncbi:MAG: CarD family transcriptional regulator [Alphaproteobacteria bacterium]|jgi:CarD family transcriptional regulator|nr:CarD family transcriptional regulator [Alphaproteobacteria bacterium]MBT4016564.1 CarD family transcriptional regulator [Alphaproteobacteria bacterium]MBT4967151.1 CarD family transcriptional regulator [Alphaproteobacteria bacterium]MBT5158518.1 CarD family transcriptional regulator [Alphaproteobacteria bacterium]MBT5920371.1 CarD family transcriptional regulator [Alphaproteobacteria bacterium]